MSTPPVVATHAQLAATFARAFPALADRLPGTAQDPDTERLVEGYVELAHRVDRVLSATASRAAQFYAELLCPEILRPFPAATILELASPSPAREQVPAGAEFDSVFIEGARCRFRAHAPFTVVPFRVAEARLGASGTGGTLELQLASASTTRRDGLPLLPVRLHLASERRSSLLLLAWLHEHLADVELDANGKKLSLGRSAFRAWGYARSEALLPEEALEHPGFRLLREFLVLSAKFAFFDISGPAATTGADGRATLRLRCNVPPPLSAQVDADAVRTNCVPVANVFEATGDPIAPSIERGEHLVRPAGHNPEHGEVYAVRSVTARLPTGRVMPLAPAAGLGAADPQALPGLFYALQRVTSPFGLGADTTLALTVPPDVPVPPEVEVLSLELWATQRALSAGLGVGAVNVPTLSSPARTTFRNIRALTPYRPAPHGELLAYHALGLAALTGRSLAERASLQGLLSALDLHAHEDAQAARALVQRLDAIAELSAKPSTARLAGILVRGHEIALGLSEGAFDGDGEAFVFARVVAQLLAHEASLNTFVRTTARLKATGRTFRFPALHCERTLR